MIPRWMLLESMVGRLGALRRDSAVRSPDADVESAVQAAVASVTALHATSDEEAFQRAWQAIDRAGVAVSRARRLSTSLGAAAPRDRGPVEPTS